jgi:hypothetical protein
MGEDFLLTKLATAAGLMLILAAGFVTVASADVARHQQHGFVGARVGTLKGVLSVCCSAAGSTPEAGVVVVSRIGGGSRSLAVGRSGRFSLSLRAGRYRVVGGIPRLDWAVGRCLSVPNSSTRPSSSVSLRFHRTTQVDVVCQGQ